MNEKDGLKLGNRIIDLFIEQSVKDNGTIDVSHTLLILTGVKQAMAQEWIKHAKESEPKGSALGILMGMLTEDLLLNKKWLSDLLDKTEAELNE